MAYNWQQIDWTIFDYDKDRFDEMALHFQEIAGQSMGYMKGLSLSEQDESIITLLVKEAIKTSINTRRCFLIAGINHLIPNFS